MIQITAFRILGRKSRILQITVFLFVTIKSMISAIKAQKTKKLLNLHEFFFILGTSACLRHSVLNFTDQLYNSGGSAEIIR